MQHVQAVQARIATIQGLVESARPSGARAGAFRSALNAALAPPDQAAGVAEGPPAAAPGEAAALMSMGMSFASATQKLSPATGARGVSGAGPAALQAPVQARVSSRFGARVHPVTGERHNHSGVDFAAPAGTPVRAAAAGRVEFAGTRGGYGNLVIVEHADGTETWYAHQRDLAVRAGDQVGAGAVLGTVGSTGRSTGPHLHLEVRRNGVAVDPLPLLAGAGVRDHSHPHG